MTQIAAVVYTSSAAAHEALTALQERREGEALELIDAVVAIKAEDGRVHLEQTVDKGRAGAGAGAFWGSLLDLFLMAPVAGAAAGAALGGIEGYGSDFGISDDFAIRLAQNFRIGHAALLAMIEDDQATALADTLATHGGALLYSTLSSDADARLRETLEAK